MLKLSLTEEAQEDLRGIRAFTKRQWGIVQSTQYIREIREKINLLTENPCLGIDRSADLEEGARSILVGSHAIYYEFNATVLTVRAILHQAMIPDKHLQRF